MNATLAAVDPDTWEFRFGSRLLARYSANTRVDVKESPKPCLHPVHTLAGDIVTDFRPADHVWHHGIAWAFTYINGDTFWGGPTFRDPEQGYGWLENHGTQRHVAWLPGSVEDTGNARSSTLVQSVRWHSANGEPILAETRRITATVLDDKTWQLGFDSMFTSIAAMPLVLQSPVGRGRPDGGYFGLMWRGAPSWAHGTLHTATDESAVMGQRAAWLIYRRPEIEQRAASLVFIDHPNNPRFPTTWFARNADQPLASFAFAYQEPFTLSPGSELNLKYAIVVSDSAIGSKSANELARNFRSSSRQ